MDKLEREWLCHVSPTCVRVFLGGGVDQSQNGWVAWSSLLQDVPHLVHAFEANPSVFKPRKRAPKRACTAVRDSVLPPPPPALPVAPRHPRQVRSSVVVREHNSVGVVVFSSVTTASASTATCKPSALSHEEGCNWTEPNWSGSGCVTSVHLAFGFF